MKKFPISILCGLAAVLVTVIMYWVILGEDLGETMCLVTLFGVLFAEFVSMFLAYFAKKEPGKVMSAAASIVMVPIALVLSIIYSTAFTDSFVSYFGIYASIYIILMVVVGIVWKFSGGAQAQRDALNTTRDNMLNFRKMVKAIMLEPGAAAYQKELNAIEEKLHFSNSAVITAADSEIYTLLSDLQSNINSQGFNVPAQIELISKKIDIRNIFANKTV